METGERLPLLTQLQIAAHEEVILGRARIHTALSPWNALCFGKDHRQARVGEFVFSLQQPIAMTMQYSFEPTVLDAHQKSARYYSVGKINDIFNGRYQP